MKWKRALFGYRESEVNRYIQDVAEARDRESDAYHEKIRAAEVTKLQQEAAMETMRHDIGVRHARLEKVESGIVSMYYRFIQSQAERDPGQIQKSAETGGYSLSRGEGKRLSKKRALSTSFLGVAPKDLAEYLISREQDHKELISGLSDKLHKLEKAIETQSEEIRKLEGFLKQPEMQESFIDMAERFLARFEQMLQDTVRKTMYPGSGGNGGGGSSGGGSRGGSGDGGNGGSSGSSGGSSRGSGSGSSNGGSSGLSGGSSPGGGNGGGVLRGRLPEQTVVGSDRRTVGFDHGTVGFDREEERLRERELIIQIAKSRRKIKELLRSMDRWREEGSAAELAMLEADGVYDAGDAIYGIGLQGSMYAGAGVGTKAGAGAEASVGNDGSDTDTEGTSTSAGLAMKAGSSADMGAKADASADMEAAADVDSGEINKAISAAYDAIASANSIIGINAAYSAAIKLASITEDGDTEDVASGRDAMARDRSLRLLYLLDKRAGEDLRDEYGRVLIRKGDPVYLDTAEEIDRRGLMDQLVKNLA